MAVLTFANLTGNPADEWVGQGMAESLTTDFAKVRGLRSISREQIFDVQRRAGGLQGRMVDERQSIDLGRRLGATWVVAGAVQRLGDRVRITAQTIAVQEGRTVSATEDRRHDERHLRAAGPPHRGSGAAGSAARTRAE